MRSLLLVTIITSASLAACGRSERISQAKSQAAAASSTSGGISTKRARTTGDSADAALGQYLALSREGGRANPKALDSLMGCSMGDGMYHPIEMLAAFEIGRTTWRGDTAVVHAKVTTVAEEDGDPHVADRYVATQRVQSSERSWDVVRDQGRWRICAGPQFGFYGSSDNTTWRPAGASAQTARSLADSVWRAVRQ